MNDWSKTMFLNHVQTITLTSLRDLYCNIEFARLIHVNFVSLTKQTFFFACTLCQKLRIAMIFLMSVVLLFFTALRPFEALLDHYRQFLGHWITQWIRTKIIGI